MNTFHYATVIDNNDSEQAGRVQIKIEYLHADCEDSMLPWAKQFSLSTGGSADFGSSSIPEIGSLVWVWFPDEMDMKKPYYIADVQLKGMNPHLLFQENIQPSIQGFASQYPDVKFTYLSNGICFGASSGATPEYFIVHPKGAVVYIDQLGDVSITDANYNSVTMDSTGIVLQGLGVEGTIDSMVLGSKLVTVLQNLCTAIKGITTINCVPGSPVTLNPASIAAFTSIAGTLSTILSQQNKTN